MAAPAPRRGGSSGGRRGFDRNRPRKYTKLNVEEIDYKDLATIRRFISDRGKIRSRRITGACRRHQNQIATAVKRARELALLPYVGADSRDERGRDRDRDRGDRREDDAPAGGVDISGPCDEAEHANDPRCTGVTPRFEDDDVRGHDRGDDHGGDREDHSGPGNGDDDAREHDNSAPGSGGDDADGDDDHSGHGGGGDDD